MEKTTRLTLGQIVKATRGRDEGKLKKVSHLIISKEKIDLEEVTSDKNLRQRLKETEVFRG